MDSHSKKYKIVYCLPALYMAGGMERVLTMKASYMADHYGYDITIIVTEGEGKPLFYPLSDRIRVINLNIGFEELWNQPFYKKVLIYLKKQRLYRQRLTEALMRIRPDITVSMLRREINFINDIQDGSKKIGEIHINRLHYRNFEGNEAGFVKSLFAKLWMRSLVKKLKRLSSFVVLTDSDKASWPEIDHVVVIPNPLSFTPTTVSTQSEKRVIAVGRYCHEKGYDHLLQAWAKVQTACPDWRLVVYGDGDRSAYEQLLEAYHIEKDRCALMGRTSDVLREYVNSSLAVCSSRFEGFGLVIIEAMACGLPVVSFDCPWGPRSIITQGEDGLLVENGNVEELAEAMTVLMDDADKRRKMAAHAVENVKRFTIEEIAGKWKNLFESLV